MKKNSNLFVYILINVFVSAVITLTVLWLWDLTHPQRDETPTMIIPTSENNDLPQSVSTPDEIQPSPNEPTLDFVQNDPEVTIHTIVGVGNLEMEYVEIHNQSGGSIDLTGWQLANENNQTFTFPGMILNNEGAIKVLSKQGSNTVIELFWQSDTPIWQSGETATLLNAAGETIAFYSIP